MNDSYAQSASVTVPNKALSPRSLLVSAFLDQLNAQGVPYVIMNNYKDLPRVIPSDVDIAVQPDYFASLDATVTRFAFAQGAEVVQKIWHGDLCCAYIIKIGSGENSDFVQLDFFVGFSMKFCPRLIPHNVLLDGRQPLRNFFIPRPEVEMVFTTMRRFFKDDWSERHCVRIAELRADCGPNAPHAPYDWLTDVIELACRGEVETLRNRRKADWANLRGFAMRQLPLLGKLRNAVVQSRRTAARLRDETGNMSLLSGFGMQREKLTLPLLDRVFHRRLLIGADWHSARRARPMILLVAQLAFLKRRKALIFVDLDGADEVFLKFVRKLVRSRLVDQMLKANESSPAPDLGLPATVTGETWELIEAISASQIAKTTRALQRGGTQTGSGSRSV